MADVQLVHKHVDKNYSFDLVETFDSSWYFYAEEASNASNNDGTFVGAVCRLKCMPR